MSVNTRTLSSSDIAFHSDVILLASGGTGSLLSPIMSVLPLGRHARPHPEVSVRQRTRQKKGSAFLTCILQRPPQRDLSRWADMTRPTKLLH
jgi:hypothetical protein